MLLINEEIVISHSHEINVLLYLERLPIAKNKNIHVVVLSIVSYIVK